METITIGGNDYDSYASVAEADAYLAVDPVRKTAWTAKSVDDKGGLLVAATRRMDLLSFDESKWEYADAAAAASDGATPPDALRDATILLAGTAAATPSATQAGGSVSNRKRVQAGSASVEFFRSTKGVALPDETAWALLQSADLLASSAAVAASVGSMASGTDRESAFGDDYGLSEGYS